MVSVLPQLDQTRSTVSLTIIPDRLSDNSRTFGFPCNAAIDAYLATTVDSDNTRRAYRRHLRAVLGAVTDWSGPGLAAYRARVLTNGRKPPSQAQALAALRCCLTWARTMGAHDPPADVVATALRAPRTSVRRPYVVLTDPEAAPSYGWARPAPRRAQAL